jgi:NAD(P)-dependent dehydrogenase (short-subunit alcohol dehydrogenase family)
MNNSSMTKNISIIGCSGAIGSAFTNQLSVLYPDATIHAFSRDRQEQIFPNLIHHIIDYQDVISIEESALVASKDAPLDLVIVATGILHDDELMPEKSLRELSAEKFLRLFEVNTILPALVAKYFLPKLNREHQSIFAVLSARVGSISDNRLGGWYAYRASKAALNMIIKNAAIEISRRNTNAVIVGLHPGTVDSALSRPFQGNVPDGKLFTPEFSVQKLLEVLEKLTPQQSGKCFAWNGQVIDP